MSSKKFVPVAVAQLILKRGAAVSTAKGVKIFKLGEDGRPEYRGATMLWFKNDIDALYAGARETPLYLGEPYEPVTPVSVESVKRK